MRNEETADIDFDRDYESIRQVPAGPGEEAGREKAGLFPAPWSERLWAAQR